MFIPQGIAIGWRCRPLIVQFDHAIIRARDGDAGFALPRLRELLSQVKERIENPVWERYERIVCDLIACLESGRPAEPVLQPYSGEGRAATRITPLPQQPANTPRGHIVRRR